MSQTNFSDSSFLGYNGETMCMRLFLIVVLSRKTSVVTWRICFFLWLLLDVVWLELSSSPIPVHNQIPRLSNKTRTFSMQWSQNGKKIEANVERFNFYQCCFSLLWLFSYVGFYSLPSVFVLFVCALPYNSKITNKIWNKGHIKPNETHKHDSMLERKRQTTFCITHDLRLVLAAILYSNMDMSYRTERGILSVWKNFTYIRHLWKTLWVKENRELL